MNLFLVLLLLLFSLNIHAQGNCQFVSHSPGVSAASINGGRIYTHFNRHLNGESDALLEIFANTNPGNLRAAVTEFLNREDISRVIDREQKETQELLKLLQSESISWVGIEASPEMEANYSLAASIEEYRRMKLQMSSIPNIPQNRVEELLHLFFSSSSIALGELSPEDSRRIRTVPLETQSARELYYEAQRQDELRFSQLVALAPSNISHEQIDRAEDIFFNAKNENRALSEEEISGAMAGISNQAHESLRRYLDVARSYAEANARREQTVAESGFSQRGDGVILIGEIHKRGIETNLENLCNGTTQPIPTSATENES